MRFTRARYIAICQQFLVTAVVVAVGLSAAGVMTLQIVAPQARPGGAIGAANLEPAIRISDAYVDTRPITPKVREVKVAAVAAPAARTAPTTHGLQLAALTQPQQVHGYATAGVTWAHGVNLREDQIAIQLRTSRNGVWSAWSTAQYHADHGPDADEPEGDADGASVRPGTDAVVIGDVDQVQMKAETSTGVPPAGLQLALVDPGTGTETQQPPAIDTAKLPESDTTATTPPVENTGPTPPGQQDQDAGTTADLDLMAMKIAPRPTIYSRAQWGANEAMRDKSSLHYGTVKTGFIHHTVNANNYTAAQVPSLLRGIYAYHTQSRGWSDIGYNYLVDRFGRIWEGRYGGVNRAVVGAHTKGYNEVSFAMSAIGNFDIAHPPQVVLDAYARLFAWKLSLYDIPADKTRIWVKNRYLHAINGHRDVGQTACPGRYLYAKLPSIRTAARKIQLGATTPPAPVVPEVDQPVLQAPADTPAPTTPPMKANKQPELDLPARISMGGSGWADIVTMNAEGDIRVTPTEGMTGFGTRVTSRGPWATMSLITAVGDVTGDGIGDVLAKSRGTRYARVFAGTGQGAVSPRGIGGTNAFHYANLVIGAGDFNRDGHNDVISRDWRDRGLYLHLGQSKGTFAAPRLIARNWNYVRTTAVGDYNGDGRVDLMVQGAENQLYLIAGKGGTSVSSALGSSMKLRKLTAGITAMAGWGDLDGDGKADLLVRSAGNGLVRLYTGQGNGRVQSTLGPFTNLRGLSQASLGPMMAGRAADFVGRDSSGQLVVVANNGRRNTSGPLPGNLRVKGVTQLLQVGDWDLDGHADVITREVGGDRLVLRRGLGNGKFTRGRSLGNGWKQVTQLAAVGDVTGDRHPDLIGRIGGSRAILFPGNGLAAFKAPQYPSTELATYNQIGEQVWRTTPTPPTVVTSADGSFVPFVGADAAAAVRTAGAAPSAYDDLVGVGDVNGDALADVIAREKSTGTLWLLPGKTSGGFAPRVWVAAGFAGYQLIG